MSYAIDFKGSGESDLPELKDIMSSQPDNRKINASAAYHYLANMEEYPEMLPLAYRVVEDQIDTYGNATSLFSPEYHQQKYSAKFLEQLPELLKNSTSVSLLNDLLHNSDRRTFDDYLLSQLGLLVSISGCWLQNILRVSSAHTVVAGRLGELFSLQTLAYSGEFAHHSRHLQSSSFSLDILLQELDLSKQPDLASETEEFTYTFALLPVSIGQFPRNYLPELIGLNIAWHFLGIQAFIEKESIASFIKAVLPGELNKVLDKRHDSMKELALQAVTQFMDEQAEMNQTAIWRRILSGMEMLAGNWHAWSGGLQSGLDTEHADLHTQMQQLVQRKAPHAIGYHGEKRLSDHRIDELLDADRFEPAVILDALANSPYVVKGDAAKSPMVNSLVGVGGPMAGVFSVEELDLIREWIDGLGQEDTKTVTAADGSAGTDGKQVSYPSWQRSDYLQQVQAEYAGRPCSLREFYYKLVNIEYFPDVLPVVEQFLANRINQSLSALKTGERPIPDADYSHEVLEQWVFNKHREQVEAYQPFEGKPEVTREAFIDSTVALAPLLFIDGAWLQGVTGVNTIRTSIGKKMFHVFYEEVGMGKAELHHANIYRDLLKSMGIELPEVTDFDFAFSERFEDTAFEVPVLWLAISCFTRHYMPEILGLNLAVELAGLGSSNLQAHDILKYYGYPTLFVDLHNSADNVSVGHSAWALEAIKSYLDQVADREGPHHVNAHWQRIWAGMRLTLPASSDYYWNPASSGDVSSEGVVRQGVTPIFSA